MDPESWPQVSRTMLHLDSLATSLLTQGYLIQSLPVLVLWDVLNTCVCTPSLPSLSRYARFLHCQTLRRLNMTTLANRQSLLLFQQPDSTRIDLTPHPDELAQYEEDVVQREQMKAAPTPAPAPAAAAATETPETPEAPEAPVFALTTDKLQVHRVWIQTARSCIDEGHVGVAKTLLVESSRHAVAFEDEGSMAMVHELNGRIALLEGDLATAAEALHKSMGTNSSSGCGWQRPLIPFLLKCEKKTILLKFTFF